MSFNIAKRTILSSIIAASSVSTLALAQQEEGFTVTPSIGYYNMDSDRDVKDDKAYSLGLGYQFNNPWAVEFVYLNADTEQSSSGSNVDVDQYRLDGLYHLPTIRSANLTPYLAAGVGTTDFGNSSSHNNVQLNAGGGLKYAVNDTVSLRADFRLVDDVEDHHLDNITSLGVQMTFGRPATRTTSDDSGYTPVEATTYTQAEPEPVPVAESQQAIEPEVVNAEPMPAEDAMQDEPVMIAPVVAQNEEPELTEQAPKVAALPPVKLNVLFGNNKTDVEQKYYPEIEKLAMFLKEHPQSTVLIEGHTDDTGAASYNQTVSEKRAKAIADVLIRTFEVSEERVSAIGYGEDTPLFDNDTAEHRKANRRVVAVISSQ
ncbi:OmpA family protein [Marinomonas sp. RSW2]|uniref:OmpA family protein n=1 Tax=Marinomonas maritima TaxID=2940935 RepID=A0ABT5W966_9GAMM|nr:OmpA family protein [Marinomonas maritima]MDE8601359.1 OmpA family protein [Marinomonas maritima]